MASQANSELSYIFFVATQRGAQLEVAGHAAGVDCVRAGEGKSLMVGAISDAQLQLRCLHKCRVADQLKRGVFLPRDSSRCDMRDARQALRRILASGTDLSCLTENDPICFTFLMHCALAIANIADRIAPSC